MDVMEAVESEILIVPKTSLNSEALYQLLQISKKGSIYNGKKLSLIKSVINSFSVQFGVPLDEYEPEFLSWLYSHEFWEVDPNLCYHYVFQYLNEQYAWPLTVNFIDYLQAKGIYYNAPQATLDQVPKEISRNFGLLKKIRILIEEVLQGNGSSSTASKRDKFLLLFQKYCNGAIFEIPPWADRDSAFFREEQEKFERIFTKMIKQNLWYVGDDLKWTQVINTGKWAKRRPDDLTIYYSHSVKRKSMERADLHLIKKQFLDFDKIINPTDFDWQHLEINTAKQRRSYCREFINSNVDILIFSEYQGHIPYNVYSEVQEARKKILPIFLLRDELFWMCPKIKLDDPKNRAINYARVCATPYDPLQDLSKLFDLR